LLAAVGLYGVRSYTACLGVSLASGSRYAVLPEGVVGPLRRLRGTQSVDVPGHGRYKPNQRA